MYLYHKTVDLSEYVLVLHDVALARRTVGDVRQNAQGLLFERIVVELAALEDHHHRLHDLTTVRVHHRVDVCSRAHEIAYETERFQHQRLVLIGQQLKQLVDCDLYI